MACELQQVGGTGDTAALSSLTLGMAPQGWTGSAPLLEGDLGSLLGSPQLAGQCRLLAAGVAKHGTEML